MRTRQIVIFSLIGCIVFGISRIGHNQAAASRAFSKTLHRAPASDEPQEIIAKAKHMRASGTTLHRLAPVEFRNLGPKLLSLVSIFEKQSGFLENPHGFTDADWEMVVRKEFWSRLLDLNEKEVLQLVHFYECPAASEFIGDDTLGSLLYYRLGQLDGPKAISALEVKLIDLLEADSGEELDISDPFGIAGEFTSHAHSFYSGWASVDHDAASAHWNEFLQTRIEGNSRIVQIAEFRERIARYLKRGALNDVNACPNLTNWE